METSQKIKKFVQSLIFCCQSEINAKFLMSSKRDKTWAHEPSPSRMNTGRGRFGIGIAYWFFFGASARIANLSYLVFPYVFTDSP